MSRKLEKPMWKEISEFAFDILFQLKEICAFHILSFDI